MNTGMYKHMPLNASLSLQNVVEFCSVFQSVAFAERLIENLCHFVATNTVINEFLFVVAK